MLNHIGAGLLLSVVFSRWFGFEVNVTFVLCNIVLAYLPDIDVAFELLQRGKVGGKEQGFHRSVTHFPAILIVVSVCVALVISETWGYVLGIHALTHVLLDSFGESWGIQWLWPFDKRSWKLFARKEDGSFSLTSLASWTPVELRTVMQEHGDDEWLRNIYGNITHPQVMSELVIIIIGMLVVILAVL